MPSPTRPPDGPRSRRDQRTIRGADATSGRPRGPDATAGRSAAPTRPPDGPRPRRDRRTIRGADATPCRAGPRPCPRTLPLGSCRSAPGCRTLRSPFGTPRCPSGTPRAPLRARWCRTARRRCFRLRPGPCLWSHRGASRPRGRRGVAATRPRDIRLAPPRRRQTATASPRPGPFRTIRALSNDSGPRRRRQFYLPVTSTRESFGTGKRREVNARVRTALALASLALALASFFAGERGVGPHDRRGRNGLEVDGRGRTPAAEVRRVDGGAVGTAYDGATTRGEE